MPTAKTRHAVSNLTAVHSILTTGLTLLMLVMKTNIVSMCFSVIPLVPKAVLGGSDIFVIQPSNGRTWTSSQAVKVLHPREHKGPTETEIHQWFSTVRASVLQFHSLYNIYDNFNDKSYIHDKAFDTNTNAKLSGPITC